MIRAASAVLFALLALLPGAAVAQPAVRNQAEYSAEVAKRRAFLANTYAQVNVRQQPKWYPYFVLARTKARGCDPKLSDYMAGVLDELDPNSAGGKEPEIFAEPPLARFVHAHRECLSPDQLDRITRSLARPRHLFDHGTLNMAAMRTTSLYLMAQAFPGVTWTDRDGRRLRSAELQTRLKGLMVRRYSRFLQTGEAEQLSPTYAANNLSAALNIVESARDSELKAYAEAYAVQLLTILRLSSVQGVILAPILRNNAQQRSGPAQAGRPCISVAQHFLWLYFGEPEIGSRDLDSGCEPTYVAMLSASEWVPPLVLASAPDAEAAPVEHTIAVPDFSLWEAPPRPALSGKVYRSKHFAIGSGNAVFDPEGYHMAESTFTLAWSRSGAEYNYIECFHPYWTSNAGVDAWSTSRVPPFFFPYATSRSSPFQQSYFDRGRGVLLFSIPDTDPWPYSREPRFFAARDKQKDHLFVRQNCHFPKAVDEWRQDGSWVFIRAGETYVGVEAVGLTPKLTDVADDPTVLGFVKLTTEARHAALFFVAEEASRHRSFRAFQDHARMISRRHDPERDTFSFSGEGGVMNKVAFKLGRETGTDRVTSIPVVTANGKPLAIDAEPVIRGPAYQVGKGRLHVQSRVGTLDIIARPSAPPEIVQRLH
jgi:hypothetical protein